MKLPCGTLSIRETARHRKTTSKDTFRICTFDFDSAGELEFLSVEENFSGVNVKYTYEKKAFLPSESDGGFESRLRRDFLHKLIDINWQSGDMKSIARVLGVEKDVREG
jgi:hypothetical protein